MPPAETMKTQRQVATKPFQACLFAKSSFQQGGWRMDGKSKKVYPQKDEVLANGQLAPVFISSIMRAYCRAYI